MRDHAVPSDQESTAHRELLTYVSETHGCVDTAHRAT